MYASFTDNNPQRDRMEAASMALEAAAYDAGLKYALAGHKTLPIGVEVAGVYVPVRRSISLAGKAFVRGWKSAK